MNELTIPIKIKPGLFINIFPGATGTTEYQGEQVKLDYSVGKSFEINAWFETPEGDKGAVLEIDLAVLTNLVLPILREHAISPREMKNERLTD